LFFCALAPKYLIIKTGVIELIVLTFVY